MKKNILNEINQMKYLFDYKKGVVISEQKIILNEGKIEDIVKGLKDASQVLDGTHEQDFANSLRKILNWDEYNKVDELLRRSGDMGLAGLIFDEFDAGIKDDQYWLKEFDKHFKSIGLSTTFASGKQGKIQPGSFVKPRPTYKEGWNELVNQYKLVQYKQDRPAGPGNAPISHVFANLKYNGKEYRLQENGHIYDLNFNYLGVWSWENNNVVLGFWQDENPDY